MSHQPIRILRKKEVSQILGLSIATIDRMLARGEFVKPIKLSTQAIGFDETEITGWLQRRKAARHH